MAGWLSNFRVKTSGQINTIIQQLVCVCLCVCMTEYIIIPVGNTPMVMYPIQTKHFMHFG